MAEAGDVPGGMTTPEGFRSGFTAIVGRPNVGKSTLLNHLTGARVAIVSDKPQTTRNTIQAVVTREDAQMVFVDTPGLHRPAHPLGEYMVKQALDAAADVDVVLFLVDAAEGVGAGDRRIAAELARGTVPVLLAVNKMDRVRGGARGRVLETAAALGSFQGPVPISALLGDGLAELLDALVARLPQGPKYYPDDWVTDHPERFVAAEFVREQVLRHTREEVPHGAAVVVEEMRHRPGGDLVDIRATIYVERESHKGILIGRGGGMLREIGRDARETIEGLLGSQVYLELWVKVKRDWRKKEGALKELGYG